MTPADTAVVDRWWAQFRGAGVLPDDLTLVQGRLVRAVHRGELPSGPVFVKTMTFPRAKDRLRYLIRPLPLRHEAAMLAAVAGAGLPVPAVLACRTARRWGVPFRAMLVLRALPVAQVAPAPPEQLRRAAGLTRRLLQAGIRHRDLHAGNFVALADGGMAVLDLQSASRVAAGVPTAAERIGAAARLCREWLPAAWVAAALVDGGLLGSADEVAAAVALAGRERRDYAVGRVRRCLGTSTDFVRRIGLAGVTYERRGGLPPGRWLAPDRDGLAVWLGQRVRHLDDGLPPLFPAFFRRWWWPAGMGSLYLPASHGEDPVAAAVAEAKSGYARFCRGYGSVDAQSHAEERT